MSLGCSEWGLYLGRGIQKGMFSVLSGDAANLLI